MKKLVRDLIPNIINKSGRKALFYQAGDSEFRKLLKEKLREEVNEFLESESMEEIADILEVIDAICSEYKVDLRQVNQIKEDKSKEKGSFKNKIVLIDDSNSPNNQIPTANNQKP